MKTKLKQQAISEYLLNNSMARQAIINGNFDVWQRGTSVTNPATTIFLADRWRIGIINNGALPSNMIHSRQTLDSGDIPNAFYYYRISSNGAGSGFGTGDAYSVTQKLENGVRFLCGAGKKVTVSFWARSNIANKKLGVHIIQRYGSGGSPSSLEIINGSNWTLTSTWKKYTHTFETNTLVGKTFGENNDDYIELRFSIMWGSSYAVRYGAGTSAEDFGGAGNVDIAQVQLCAGEVALPFMPKSFAEELRACQRYCYFIKETSTKYLTAVTGHASPPTIMGCTLWIPTPMRNTPTMSINGDMDFRGNGVVILTGTTITNIILSFNSINFGLNITTGARASDNNSVFHLINSNGRSLVVDAEL